MGEAKEANAPLSPSDQNKIYAAGYTTKKEHSGLGLYIIKQIADRNGGQLELREAKEYSASVKRNGLRNIEAGGGCRRKKARSVKRARGGRKGALFSPLRKAACNTETYFPKRRCRKKEDPQSSCKLIHKVIEII
jgi:ABC-type proline/glycine betaine transport system substrate-binding protein